MAPAGARGLAFRAVWFVGGSRSARPPRQLADAAFRVCAGLGAHGCRLYLQRLYEAREPVMDGRQCTIPCPAESAGASNAFANSSTYLALWIAADRHVGSTGSGVGLRSPGVVA